MEEKAVVESTRITTVRDRNFRPKFTLDIGKTVAGLERAQLAERTTMTEIIGVEKHQPSHAWYFKCYERMDVHRTMINDPIRTGTYLLAISRNKHLFQDKIILDVGAGTAVLSIFAVKEGAAKKAIAVDASAVTKAATLLVQGCGLEDRIAIVREKIENVQELPGGVGQVDVIVAEWMGYGLFSESVLESVITARRRFLKEGGFILPDMTKLRILGSTATRERPIDPKVLEAQGILFTMAPLDLTFLPAAEDYFAVNARVTPNQILTDADILKVIDMYTVQPEDIKVDSDFCLTCSSHGWFRSFVLFFDVLFDLPNAWMFSTSPDSPPTHWLQTICCLPPGELFEVWRDTMINGTVRMDRMSALPRFWTVEIHYTVTWKKRPAVTRSRVFYLL